MPATLLKKTPAQVFSCEYGKIFKNSFFYRTSPLAASAPPKIAYHILNRKAATRAVL